jgi:hypothetical protein
MEEDAPAKTYADNLKRQADQKADQAKKLKQAASVEKKREQVNGARTDLMTKQRDLLKATAQKYSIGKT